MSKKNGKPCERCGTSEWYRRGQCKECKRASMRAYSKTPHGRAVQSAYQDEYQKSYFKTPARKEQIRKYNQSKRGKAVFAAMQSRRRTKMSKAGGSFTASEWVELCNHYGNVCLKCGSAGKLEADHIVSVVNGGTSDISNIQPLCRSCNASKGTKNKDYRKGNFITRWIQEKML